VRHQDIGNDQVHGHVSEESDPLTAILDLDHLMSVLFQRPLQSS
jgi:hypothetical protein